MHLCLYIHTFFPFIQVCIECLLCARHCHQLLEIDATVKTGKMFVCGEGLPAGGVRGQDQNSFYFLDIYLIVPVPVVEGLFFFSPLNCLVVFQEVNWLHMWTSFGLFFSIPLFAFSLEKEILLFVFGILLFTVYFFPLNLAWDLVGCLFLRCGVFNQFWKIFSNILCNIISPLFSLFFFWNLDFMDVRLLNSILYVY